MKKLTLTALVLTLALLASGSPTYQFNCITNNSGVCPTLAPQFSATATDNGTFVSFDFANATGGLESFIAQVYFDDPSGTLSFLSLGTLGWSLGGTPANLPAGNNVGFISTFLVSADNPSPSNGIHPGKDLIVNLSVAVGHTFSESVNQGLDLGIHVQGFRETSESLYSGGSKVPEPALLGLTGLGLVGLGLTRFLIRR